MSEPTLDLPCGCKADTDDPKGPIFWNEFNAHAQCHKCGQTYLKSAPDSANLEEIAREAAQEIADSNSQTQEPILEYHAILSAIQSALAPVQAELEQAKGRCERGLCSGAALFAGKEAMTEISFFVRGTPKGQPRARFLTPSDLEIIKSVYSSAPLRGDGQIKSLCQELGRTKNMISRYAGYMGLTTRHRRFSSEQSGRLSCRMKSQWQKQPHPRGMAGKRHSPETKLLISEKGMGRKKSSESVLKMLRTRVAKFGSTASAHPLTSWKAGWREIGGKRIYARSRWEANYARYLQLLKESGQIVDWEHEAETFWFEAIRRGCRSYLPDFRVTVNHIGLIEYHEVKGWMDSRSKTKLKRMAKYYPSAVIILIRGDWFKRNGKKLKGLIRGWET